MKNNESLPDCPEKRLNQISGQRLEPAGLFHQMVTRLSSCYLWQKGYIVRKQHYVHMEQDLTNSLTKSIQQSNMPCFRIVSIIIELLNLQSKINTFHYDLFKFTHSQQFLMYSHLLFWERFSPNTDSNLLPKKTHFSLG